MGRSHLDRKTEAQRRFVNAVSILLADLKLIQADECGFSVLSVDVAEAHCVASTHRAGEHALEISVATRRRIKGLIVLLKRYSAITAIGGNQILVPKFLHALRGVLVLANAVRDPMLSAALRSAALLYLMPDGA